MIYIFLEVMFFLRALRVSHVTCYFLEIGHLRTTGTAQETTAHETWLSYKTKRTSSTQLLWIGEENEEESIE